MSPPGTYRPIRTISRGGMGTVELAVRQEGDFQRLCAIKRLHPHLRDEPACLAMFADEARIAGLVHHPNVVGVLDVGHDDQGPFLVMEYVEGVPLSDLIRHIGSSGELVPVQLCLRITAQIARGLQATHEATAPDGSRLGVVHRDISPQNVLVAYDGIVRITDFGIAKALRRATPRTTTAVLKGKVGYMAPEQLRFEEADHRADLHALGVILYELLSGERLYRGNEQEAARQVLLKPPPDIEDVREDVPPAVVELLFELLAKRPDLRPDSARVVARRLEEALVHVVTEEGALRLDELVQQEFAGRRQREREQLAALMSSATEWPPRREPFFGRWWLAAAASALLLAGAGAYALVSWLDPAPPPTSSPVTAAAGAEPAPGIAAEAARADAQGAVAGLPAERSTAAAEPPGPAGRTESGAPPAGPGDEDASDEGASAGAPADGVQTSLHPGSRDGVSSGGAEPRRRRPRRSSKVRRPVREEREDEPRVKVPLWQWP